MGGMLHGFKELIPLDLSNYNSSKVKDIRYIFSTCNKLKGINQINE